MLLPPLIAAGATRQHNARLAYEISQARQLDDGNGISNYDLNEGGNRQDEEEEEERGATFAPGRCQEECPAHTAVRT